MASVWQRDSAVILINLSSFPCVQTLSCPSDRSAQGFGLDRVAVFVDRYDIYDI